MIYTIYNPDTGQISSTLTLAVDDPTNVNLLNNTYIVGNYPAKDYYIEDGKAVRKSTDPSTNLVKYDYNYSTKTWMLNEATSSMASRSFRNTLLQDVDRVNPMWWASLSESQQQELQAYRQALLDVTDQAGFPSDVTWPTKPAFL